MRANRLRWWQSGTTGAVDVFLGLAAFGTRPLDQSLAWGGVAFVAFFFVTCLWHRVAPSLGLELHRSDDEEFDQRVAALHDGLDHIEHTTEPDPPLVRWLLNVVIVVLWGLFSALAVVLGYSRTISTVAVCFLIADPAPWWSLAVVLAICIAIHTALDYALFRPLGRTTRAG